MYAVAVVGAWVVLVTMYYLARWTKRQFASDEEPDREDKLPPKHGKDRRVPGGE